MKTCKYVISVSTARMSNAIIRIVVHYVVMKLFIQLSKFESGECEFLCTPREINIWIHFQLMQSTQASKNMNISFRFRKNRIIFKFHSSLELFLHLFFPPSTYFLIICLHTSVDRKARGSLFSYITVNHPSKRRSKRHSMHDLRSRKPRARNELQ